MHWALADMRLSLPALSLSLMALLLALSTNIGVSTMVGSFRATFTGWLDQRLASELYLTTASPEQAARVTDYLTPRVDAILPFALVDTRFGGLPAELHGLVDHATYRDHWPFLEALPDAWSQMAEGQAVVINEQLALRAGLSVGDRVPSAQKQIIVGIYSDYGNPHPQAIVGLDRLLAERPQIENRRFGLRVDADQAQGLRADLQEAFDLPATAFIDQRALKDRSLAIFERTFVVTGALNLLTFGVAGFAMLTSLLTLWSQRLPQLAPIWAMGVTRHKLARLEVLRSVCLAALTAVLALPLGLMLGWALLAVVNVEAFGWRLPMVLFPMEWLRLFAMALMAAALAAALPALRLARLKPADLLRVFANER